jgi:hypothetical protein
VQFSNLPHVRTKVLDQAAEIQRLKCELARVMEPAITILKDILYTPVKCS